MWEFARNRGYVTGENPVFAARKPMRDEKEPFKTYDEIQKTIERGGLDQTRTAELWGCLFLRERETLEVLNHVESVGEAPFVLPLFAFAAFTGARRSEILRSQREDFDFETGQVLIREKKKSRTRKLTFRQVSLHARLKRIMRDWFQAHPGGSFTIVTPNGLPLTPSEANNVFGRAVRGSKWEVMKGYHVFRHSFASNLALKGTHPSVIDALMGHQTEEMRRRYRHLFPEETRSAIDSLF
jgi:integrase